ncbi:DUF805 domain-containing protein [Marinigracilibium pacificum]|uniref:DUF805 domain-containing protein n=1 Tax=Marinigracilibium pacificum TaxID=2729599 RepID=A0A848IYT9_9BACT|nr:DUF805 domain-containing protein [Marinigracilibium pacificum]NMM47404.1 DUF805 domain-containing protein [Marinigracilibium pacificum]
MNWYLHVLTKNYANFNGRARRQEYWMYVLFQTIFALVLYGIGITLALKFEFFGGFALYGLFTLATIIPSIAVLVRRLHDIGKSGWYYFIGLIPLVGGIILLVWLATEGERGENQYGQDPKSPESFSAADNLVADV